MEKIKSLLIVVLFFFVVIVQYKSCNLKKCEDLEVVIPEKKGVKVIEKPEALRFYDTIYIGESKVVERVVIKDSPLDLELMKAYSDAKDTIEKLRLYKDAVTLREYVEVFEDSLQKIEVKSFVTGSLDKQMISYITKKRVMQAQAKKSRGGFYLSTYLNAYNLRESAFEPNFGVKVDFVTDRMIYNVGINSKKDVFLSIGFKL